MTKEEVTKLAKIILEAERRAIWKGMLDLYENMPRKNWRNVTLSEEVAEDRLDFANGEITRETLESYRRTIANELSECTHAACLQDTPYDYESELRETVINPVMDMFEYDIMLGQAFNDVVVDEIQEMAEVMVGM